MNTNNKGPHRFRKTYLIVIVAFVFLISGIAMLGWHIAQTDMAAARQNNTDAVISDTAPEKVLFLYSYGVMDDTFDEDVNVIKSTLLGNGINNRKLANTASGDPLIAGYIEDDCIGDTIRLARKLIPDATNVVGIYDDTPLRPRGDGIVSLGGKAFSGNPFFHTEFFQIHREDNTGKNGILQGWYDSSVHVGTQRRR